MNICVYVYKIKQGTHINYFLDCFSALIMRKGAQTYYKPLKIKIKSVLNAPISSLAGPVPACLSSQ